jgi:hypothetical protein
MFYSVMGVVQIAFDYYLTALVLHPQGRKISNENEANMIIIIISSPIKIPGSKGVFGRDN